jgi:hypothetical protein
MGAIIHVDDFVAEIKVLVNDTIQGGLHSANVVVDRWRGRKGHGLQRKRQYQGKNRHEDVAILDAFSFLGNSL